MSLYDGNKLQSQYTHRATGQSIVVKHNWLRFTQDVHVYLEHGQHTNIVVTDFIKVFDKVDHHKLISQLHRLDVNDSVITWIHSIRFSRSQKVVVGSRKSDSLPVLSGVPQSSVLGPCLFLSYITTSPMESGAGWVCLQMISLSAPFHQNYEWRA